MTGKQVVFHDCRFDEDEGRNREDLADRLVAGEVFVVRQALQAFDLYEMWHQASLRGIEKSVGKEAAERAARDGYHRIHEWVAPGDIPAMTDAVYAEIEKVAPEFLQRFMQGAFPGVTSYYFEPKPNVRFHIPFDLANQHRQTFDKFAETYGQGKIAAHGPHRDSWLDCPSNGFNLWFAMGRVQHGNGLTIFAEDYDGTFKFKRSGDIQDGEPLHKATTFALEPGDCVMFHTDHMHGSELNRTDETRFVISCRMSVPKPEFPKLHYHPYAYSGWAGASPLSPLAEVPALLQPSYVKSLVVRARNKFIPSMQEPEPEPNKPKLVGQKVGERFEIPLADVPVGAIKPISGAFCVARLGEDEVVALGRRCPHAAGDLVNGWTDGGNVVCSWHNLPFDAKTGRSPCKSLRPVKRIRCTIEGDMILVDPGVTENLVDEAEATVAAE